MAGHSRSKDYVPAVHVLLLSQMKEGVDARHKAGHDVGRAVEFSRA
jgi:hypothetical protein